MSDDNGQAEEYVEDCSFEQVTSLTKCFTFYITATVAINIGAVRQLIR